MKPKNSNKCQPQNPKNTRNQSTTRRNETTMSARRAAREKKCKNRVALGKRMRTKTPLRCAPGHARHPHLNYNIFFNSPGAARAAQHADRFFNEGGIDRTVITVIHVYAQSPRVLSAFLASIIYRDRVF